MGDNLLQILFLFLALSIFSVGVGVNFFESYLPVALVQAYRYGRPNVFKTRLNIVNALEMSKTRFLHFFIFAVCWQSLVLAEILHVYLYGGTLSSWLEQLLSLLAPLETCAIVVTPKATILASVLLLIHCTRRLFECLFLDKHSEQAKMTVLHYAAAMYHYFGSSLCLLAHSQGLRSKIPKDIELLDITQISNASWLQIFGVSLFLVASYEQFQSHRILSRLRSGKGSREKYFIPFGRLYEWISCPNYLCEIIIYTSIALVLHFHNASWNCLLLWVISNQVMDAIMSHKWYQSVFQNYPKTRKALIPFML